MSWSAESDDQVQLNVGIGNKWKMGLARIETGFKNIKKLHDDLKSRFDYIQHSKLDMKEIEVKRQNLSPMVIDISEQIAQMESMVSPSKDKGATAMKNEMKELRRRAADLTMMVQKLCAAINTELYNRQMSRKKESSIISNELGYDDDKTHHNDQMQVSALEDAQLKIAMDEQKQSEKIARDMITLESIFVRLSAMVHEQGEVVNHIEANVEDAYEKTEAGVNELGKALNYKKAALKKKLCIIGIVIAALAVIALIIGLAVGIK